jgi:hypothetical protein
MKWKTDIGKEAFETLSAIAEKTLTVALSYIDPNAKNIELIGCHLTVRGAYQKQMAEAYSTAASIEAQGLLLHSEVAKTWKES